MSVDKNQNIQKVRDMYMSNRRILCTGNPNKTTLASGVREIWPDAVFMHKSNGYDLTDFSDTNIEKIQQQFKNCTTFINASYIDIGIQSQLLDLFFDTVKVGEVFNIGSTHEYDGLDTGDYSSSKIQLRDNSLQKNNFRINTTHILLGQIDRTGEHEYWIKPIEVAEAIKWIMNQRYKLPLYSIDQPKKPW
jgi:hypothetical protein